MLHKTNRQRKHHPEVPLLPCAGGSQSYPRCSQSGGSWRYKLHHPAHNVYFIRPTAAHTGGQLARCQCSTRRNCCRFRGHAQSESPMGSFPLPHTESSTLTTLAARAIRCHSSFTRDQDRFLQCWKITQGDGFPDPPEDITGIDFSE